jgi:hypothetical protein
MNVHLTRFAVATALVLGLPTDVIPNDLFGHMTPARAHDVPVLAALSVLSGLLLAALAWRFRVLAAAGLRLSPSRT